MKKIVIRSAVHRRRRTDPGSRRRCASGRERHLLRHYSQEYGSGHERFELQVSRNKVVVFEYDPSYSGNSACSRWDNSPIQVTADRGSVISGLTIGPLKRGARIDSHGFFSDKNVKLSKGDYFTFSGTFHAGKVTGKFSEHFKIYDPTLRHDISCKTGSVDYTSGSQSSA